MSSRRPRAAWASAATPCTGGAHAADQVVSPSIREHINWLQACADKLQTQIDDHIDAHPLLAKDAELLNSIPGIGQVTTPKVLAFLGDVRRFANAKALAAFIGVTPRLKESGSSVRGRSMISRAGHAQMRKALYMPALVAARHNPAVRAFSERLRASGLAPKAVVGACMHKLAVLIYGVLRSGVPFDHDGAGHGTNEGSAGYWGKVGGLPERQLAGSGGAGRGCA
jgi:transposase